MSFDYIAEVERAKYLDDLRNNLDLDRLTELKERFLEWAEDNNYEGSFEKFIESNLELLGY